jgi:sigma-E factor negative regulatory protein RseB
MLKSRYLVFVLFTVLQGAAIASTPSATSLVQHMRDALIHQNYEGTFVYMNGKDMETMHVVHEWTESGERSHITALSGEAREVHRDDKYLTCIWPESRSVLMEPVRSRDDFLLPIPTEPRSIESYYQYQLGGAQRIAGKSCQIVEILPLDDYRFGHQYCIEKETGIPLKVARMNTDGKIVEQMVFTEVNFPTAIDPKRFEYKKRTEGFNISHISRPESRVGENTFKFSGLPMGYKVDSALFQPASAGESEFYQLVISDGLANVSLFVSPDKNQGGSMKSILRSGAVHAMERMQDGYHLTAVGEVPEKTLSVILDSFVTPQQ